MVGQRQHADRSTATARSSRRSPTRESLSSIIPNGNVLGYLGRSLYQGDALLRADVSDVKFWDVALSADEVSSSMPTADAEVRRDRGAPARRRARHDARRQPVARPGVREPHVAGVRQRRRAHVDDFERARSSRPPASSRARSPPTPPVTLTADDVARHDARLRGDGAGARRVDATSTRSRSQARTTENLPLATKGAVNGAAITWTSSDPSLVTPTDASYTAPAVGCRGSLPRRRSRDPSCLRRRRPPGHADGERDAQRNDLGARLRR